MYYVRRVFLSVFCVGLSIAAYAMNPLGNNKDVIVEPPLLSCRYCGKNCKTQRSLTNHKKHICKKNPTWKPFKCRYCAIEKASRVALSKHESSCAVGKLSQVVPVKTVGSTAVLCEVKIDTSSHEKKMILQLPHRLRLKVLK